jgi:hypothetical protein
MSDRKAEQNFIKVQTTIIVLGIVVHSLIVGWAGRVISHQLDVKPADVLEQVHQTRHDQLDQYETLANQISEIREDYPKRVQVILDAIDKHSIEVK